METYSAGKVSVDIVPDTRGFWALLNAALHSRNPEVEVDAGIDMTRVNADLRRIDGKHAEVEVEFKGDTKRVDEMAREIEGRKLAVDGDFSKVRKQLDDIDKHMTTSLRNQASWQKYWDKDSTAVKKYNDLLSKQSKLLNVLGNAQAKQLKDYQNAILRAKPLGAENVFTQAEATKLRRRIDNALSDFKDGKITAAKLRVVLDDPAITKVNRALESTIRQMHEVNATEARVKIYESGADKLERRLDALRHTRLDIPADIEIEQNNLINRLREAAAKARIDPDYVFEANLDLDMRRAEERMKKFRDKNDELKMDLDLETALARAHLAYFTRPRTIDVFANFRGTDMGKIFAGMTSGATGLKGVENQFQRLVNLMDSLDTKVPKFAIIGAAFTSIGAGAVNVAGTVGGVAKSLVSMSKAAYAAPAALGAAAAGFYGLYAAVKTASDHFSLADTALAGLQSKVGGAFWDNATASITRMSNMLGDDFVRNLSEVAAEEGRVAAGLADIVVQSNGAGRITAMLDYAADGVRNLSPGLQSLVAAMTSLGNAGGQYLPQFTNWISRNMSLFAQWAGDVESDSGRIDAAMSAVKEQAGYLGSSVKSLAGIFSGTFGTLAQYENGIQGFSEALASAEKAVNSVSFQNTMNAWIDGAQAAQSHMRDSFTQIGDAADILRSDVATVLENAGATMGAVFKNLSTLAAGSGRGMVEFSAGIRDGFTSATAAIAQASPMFSEFMSMAGQLASTFGGTFASTLKAVAPTLQAIASVTSTVAKAFDTLPDSIQGALGMWVTFGRAGKTAIASLKSGMLQNIQQTLQYRSTLQKLGVTADGLTPKFRKLAAAMAALNRGEVAGALSSSLTGLRALGNEADKVPSKLEGIGTSAKEAGENVLLLPGGATKQIRDLSNEADKVPSKFSKIGTTAKRIGSMAKSAGSLLVDALGGPEMIALGAAVGVATTAWSSYQQHVSKVQATQESFNQAVSATPMALAAQSQTIFQLQNRLDNLGTTVQNNLTGDKLDFWDKITPGTAKMGNFDTAADALDKLGKSTGDAAKAASGSKKDFDAYIKQLDAIKEANTSQAATQYGGSMTGSVLNEQATAADEAAKALKKYRAQQLAALEAKAKDIGVTDGWVSKMDKAGESLQSIADGLLTQDERTQQLSAVQSKLTGLLQNQHSAQIQAASSASTYYKSLEQVRSSVQQVNDLAAKGQRVWDASAKSFDYTTEAGRTAADALTALASNSNAYLQSMIAAGQPLDKVNEKQKELSDNFNQVAGDIGVASDQIDGLNQSLLMTPEDIQIQVSAQTLQAQTALADVVEQMAFLFPDKGRTATKELLLQSIWSGKTDATELQQMVQGLANHTHEIAFDTNGKAVMVPIGELADKTVQLSNGSYHIRLDSEGDASQKVQDVESKVEGLNGTKADVQVLLDAKDDASDKIQNVTALAKAFGMSDKDMQMVINAQDNASPKLKDLRDKLRSQGLSDRQIDILFDAIDKASPKIDKAKKKADSAKGHNVSFEIDANDGKANAVLARYESKNGKTIMSSNVELNAQDNASETADQVDSKVRGIPQEWLSVLSGSDGVSELASTAAGAITSIPQWWQSTLGAFDGASGVAWGVSGAVSGIPTWWMSSLFGLDGTSQPAGTARGAVMGIPPLWQSNMIGIDQASPRARQAAQSIRDVPDRRDSTVAARVSGMSDVVSLGSYIDGIPRFVQSIIEVVTRKKTEGGAATGGRIAGPGTGTSDSIPMWLSNGEMVIRAASVRKLDAKYGRSFLNALNAYGDTPSPSQPVSARRALGRAYAMAQGGRVDVGALKVEMTPIVNMPEVGVLEDGVRDLNMQVAVLSRQVGALAATLPQTIAANSSPWPSQRAFNRDVRGAL